MTDEQKKLVEDNHNLIYHILQRMSLNIDDYYGLAAIGLCDAATAYDPDQGFKFSTFACKCIRNRLLQDIRKSKMGKRTGTVLYFDQEVDENGTTLFGTMPAKDNTEAQAIARDILRRLFTDPDPRNRKVYYLLGQGYTQQKVAAKVGVSQPQISRIQKAAKLAAMY